MGNGKQERSHGTIKRDEIRENAALSAEELDGFNVHSLVNLLKHWEIR